MKFETRIFDVCPPGWRGVGREYDADGYRCSRPVPHNPQKTPFRPGRRRVRFVAKASGKSGWQLLWKLGADGAYVPINRGRVGNAWSGT